MPRHCLDVATLSVDVTTLTKKFLSDTPQCHNTEIVMSGHCLDVATLQCYVATLLRISN